MVAAVAVVLASKLHDSNHLAMKNFPHIKAEVFVIAERQVLAKLNYCLFPTANPASFIRELSLLWAEGRYNETMISLANEFVGEILEDVQSTMYSPSTLAIASLLHACSHLGMDCDWIELIPKFLLVHYKGQYTQQEQQKSFIYSLDIDGCLELLQSLKHNMKEFSSVTPPPEQNIILSTNTTPITDHIFSTMNSDITTNTITTSTTTANMMKDRNHHVRSPNGLAFSLQAKTYKRNLFESNQNKLTVDSLNNIDKTDEQPLTKKCKSV